MNFKTLMMDMPKVRGHLQNQHQGKRISKSK
jgi:hypothetical protein